MTDDSECMIFNVTPIFDAEFSSYGKDGHLFRPTMDN